MKLLIISCLLFASALAQTVLRRPIFEPKVAELHQQISQLLKDLAPAENEESKTADSQSEAEETEVSDYEPEIAQSSQADDLESEHKQRLDSLGNRLDSALEDAVSSADFINHSLMVAKLKHLAQILHPAQLSSHNTIPSPSAPVRTAISGGQNQPEKLQSAWYTTSPSRHSALTYVVVGLLYVILIVAILYQCVRTKCPCYKKESRSALDEFLMMESEI